MNSTLLNRTLAWSTLIGAILAGPAQAATFVQLSGTTIDFFYDQDYWGVGNASVLGDSISFDVEDFSTTARVRNSTGSASSTLQDSTFPGLVAVAKTGYLLTGELAALVGGTYTLPAQGGFGQIQNYYDLHSGTFSGGSFISSGLVGYGYSYALQNSDGVAPSSGSFLPSSNAFYTGTGTQHTVGLATTLSSWSNQLGTGSSTANLQLATYTFGITPAPIPEPSQLAMLLAGLGLVALARRRRER
ncbi:PEP-CTERM sorting domain-containing protein [Chitinimonas arctica]|uniref:PEP-CTERM sorting domain-containing protein n=1 Tax=Chitinimonas arctica TaxID=2594795 RepID=A0A516SD94_9NEIS|nr:PEP-CTERM sorting domain-containing protein [Chitinimonas arctica]QDQ26110.1 PEP-CTERM sorting domain-containing protein [Chitinimonas arctica]